MFVDEARVRVAAGRGGDGCISFRREKFVPKGGPDGGDGGDGGNVLLLVDDSMRTLLHLRHRPLFKAGRGQPGEGKQRFGKRGEDCVITLPPGTTVRDAESGALIAEMGAPGESLLIARGGKGGKGNERFKSATRRTPRIATKGKDGEARELALELRLLADVGLVGLPNAGKSTLLARVSNARPRIGDYPFTTLEPNLGIVAIGDYDSLVMADIPGLVEGAHKGRGLGIRFLKHVEKTRVLLFLIDCMSDTPEEDLRILRREITKFSSSLGRRPHIVAFSKTDLREAGWEAPSIPGGETLSFSAHTGDGVDTLLKRLRELLLKTTTSERQVVAEREGTDDSEVPFAVRIDRGDDLGSHPWPQKWHAYRSDEGGDSTSDG